MKSKIIINILFFLLIVIPSVAQPDKDKSFYYDFGERFFAESYVFPIESVDSQLVVTIFRFANSVIPFTKADINNINDINKNKLTSESFVSYPIIYVEYKDSQGIIRKRDIWEKEILVGDYEATRNKEIYNFGLISSILTKDNYSIDIELSNKERTKPRKIKLPILKKLVLNSSPGLSEPIYAYKFNNQEESEFEPYLMNKNVGFGSEDCHIFLLASYFNEFEKYYFSVENKEIRDNKFSWDGKLTFKGVATPKTGQYLEFKLDELERIVLTKTILPEGLVKNEKLKIGTLEVILGADKLVPGKYLMKIWSTSLNDTLSFDFSIEWENMPLSLKNPDYAAEMMYYILPDDEYKEIKSGSSSKIFKKILDYWKKRDPTPETLYNEAMAEYFRRVDYAFFNFQSTIDKDGAKTDRGKIYILFGSPDSTERNLGTNNQTVEIWKYNKLKKEFVFQSNNSGKFELVKIIN
ncbi:MAG: GWxTD domain-containing protein [Candidatus Kapabacteria bacterium]|nr:GWxTD domain-containing protein [Candidatus Kapabacteria bacterium]